MEDKEMNRMDCFFKDTKVGVFLGSWWVAILWFICGFVALAQSDFELLTNALAWLWLLIWLGPVLFMTYMTVEKYNEYLINKISCGIFDVDKKWPRDCVYDGFVMGNAENSEDRRNQFFLLEETMIGYGYKGIEKKKAMLKRKIKYTNIKISELEKMISYTTNTLLKKEHNWATWGGIANGLAGPVAGMMTALETEAENIKVREHNAIYGPVVAFLNSSKFDSIDREKEKLNKYYKMKELLPNVQILDDETERLFKNIEINNVSAVEYTDSAMIVSADFEVGKLLREYKNACLDGSIRAKIYQNKTLVGSAYFVLPVEGVSDKTNLCAVCTKGNFAKNCEIILEPVDLWVMTK